MKRERFLPQRNTQDFTKAHKVIWAIPFLNIQYRIFNTQYPFGSLQSPIEYWKFSIGYWTFVIITEKAVVYRDVFTPEFIEKKNSLLNALREIPGFNEQAGGNPFLLYPAERDSAKKVMMCMQALFLPLQSPSRRGTLNLASYRSNSKILRYANNKETKFPNA